MGGRRAGEKRCDERRRRHEVVAQAKEFLGPLLDLFGVQDDRHPRLPRRPGGFPGSRDIVAVDEHGAGPPDLLAGDLPGAGPEPSAPPRERQEGGGHLPPSLPRETGHPELLPRHGVARNAAQVIDRIQPDSDDVEHGNPFYPGEAAPPSGNLRETAGREALSNEQGHPGESTALRKGDHAWDPPSGKGLGESRSPSLREWPCWGSREERT